jgi:hypothetical protein
MSTCGREDIRAMFAGWGQFLPNGVSCEAVLSGKSDRTLCTVVWCPLPSSGYHQHDTL